MTVLYRKYRPQKIGELDSESIQKKLGIILSSGAIPHAFLFAGPRGLGKTSSARIVAKSVNCLKNEGRGDPCGTCDMCTSIAGGTNVDILEIDAASNRGIDDIRDLRDKVRLAPTRARNKVYIIDEVHMLTTEAFNALLKTLEEPPDHTLFILCTTEPGKLPETIISRCIRLDFKKATEGEIINSLRRLTKGEKLEIEEEALPILARLGDGSFRDAHKAIEQLAMSAKKITKELVEEVFDLRDSFRSNDLLTHLGNKDSRSAILWLDDAIEKGMDIRLFSATLLSVLRSYLLKKASDVGESIEDEKSYNLFSIDDLKRLIDMISRATLELKTAAIPQLPMELAILEWCGDRSDRELRTEDKEQKDKTFDPSLSPSTSLGVNLEPSSSLRHPPPNRAIRDADFAEKLTGLEEITAKWKQVLDGVGPLNHSVQALLRGCRPLGMNGKFLILEVFYKFHKDRLEEIKSREVLEEVLKEVFGKEIPVKCVLGNRVKKETEKQSGELSNGVNDDKDEIVGEAEKIFGVQAN